MSRSPKMNYTAIATSEDGRQSHYASSSSSTSLAALRAGSAAAQVAAASSPATNTDWPRALTEPDNMRKTPTPSEGVGHSGPAYSTSSTGRSAASTYNQGRLLSEAELMALVVEKRLKASSEPFHSAAGSRSRSSSVSGRERAAREDGRSSSQSRREARDAQEANTRDTLDLCYMRIDKLPEGLVDVIKDDVVRLALGYNLLTRIPDNFAELRAVRYLNVRANNLSTFPAAICKMPGLEILDISRNKIRTLPSEPGRLLSLRVLSLNSNRLTRLAPWFAKMKHLRVLKVENNSIEWPPPHISKMRSVAPPKPPSSAGNGAAERDIVRKFEERQMIVWIAQLKTWIVETQASKRLEPARPSSSGLEAEAEAEEEAATVEILALPIAAPASASSTVDDETSPTENAPEDSGQASDQSDGPVTPKNGDRTQGEGPPWSQLPTPTEDARAAPAEESRDRENTPYLDRNHSSPRQLPFDYRREPVPPIPKHFSPHTPVAEGSASGSGAIDAQSSAYGASRIADNSRSVMRHTDKDLAAKGQHGRNNSHTIGQSTSPIPQGARRTLNAKKSLPDLRLSHEYILTERSRLTPEESPLPASTTKIADASQKQNTAQESETPPHVQSLALRRPSSAPRRPPLPQSASNPLGYHSKPGVWSSSPSPAHASTSSSGGGLRKLSLPTVGATQAAAEAAAAAMAAKNAYTHTPPRVEGHHGRMPSEKVDSMTSSRSNSPTMARNPADFERNSYFRRLSTLPPSTIAKAVPLPVLKFVDGTRGVLFALSQIHAALKQYMLFATDERISSQFNRVLDIASKSMATFINSLDRFDSLSLRGTPEPSVIRGVLMTCKESVITFRKIVSVLQLQLRALQSSADVRFTRTLLLMLYGSMAEVSNSWTAMAPQVDAVLPYLTAEAAASGAAGAGTSSLRQNGSVIKANGAAANPPSLPSIAEAPVTVRSARPYTQQARPSRRRHAGSFSAHDVAQGANIPPSAAQLPSFNLEDLQASAAYGVPSRSMRRPGQNGGAAVPHASATSGSGTDHFASSFAQQGTAHGSSTHSAAAIPGGRAVNSSSAPASPSKKRSNSNTSSTGETSGFMGSGMSAMTPIASASSAATSVSHQRHTKTPSHGNSTGFGLASASNSAQKVIIDDHLLILIDQITELSTEVWTILLTHLTGIGIESEPATPTGPTTVQTRSRSNTTTSLGERENGQAATAADRNDGRLAVAETPASVSKKLRDLRDLTHSTAELTSRLRETYHSVREEEEQVAVDGLLGRTGPSGGEDDGNAASRDHTGGVEGKATTTPFELIAQELVRRLFDESHQFIRAIVNISTLIKTISTSHAFPRELRRSLGEVTHGCSALTVHLLWLSPTSIA